MAQNGFQSGKLEKNRVPKRDQFRNPFWHGFWMDFKLKMEVSWGPWKAPWHYYSKVFGVYIVSKLEIVTGPLGDPVLVPKRPPFWSPKPSKFFQRAAKRDFGASQDGTGSSSWLERQLAPSVGSSSPRDGDDPLRSTLTANTTMAVLVTESG